MANRHVHARPGPPRWKPTSFFWASSIFLLFSSMILSSSSRFFRSSSYNDNGIYLHEAMMVLLTSCCYTVHIQKS